jgi:hypothetical protein
MNMILYRHYRGIHFYIYCYKATTVVGRTRPNSSPPSRTRTLDLVWLHVHSTYISIKSIALSFEDSKDFVPALKAKRRDIK